ncbi:MAG: hypothetical protein IPH52_18305 [Leptospiraceae bacterium]|nr:hypothetical protein [Leptospiraceae bacterium]
MRNILFAGIDVGSTTVKIALVHPEKQDSLVHFKYMRHNSEQSKTVLTLLKEAHQLYPEDEFRLAICGSGGFDIAKLYNLFYSGSGG